MRELDVLDYKLLSELMRNSRVSDKQLAKVLGASQPTITHRRASLEQDFIEGYTTIPKWERTGFEVFAITFVKSRIGFQNMSTFNEALKRAKQWMLKEPNVIFASVGEGMGWDSVMVSFHKSYSEYVKFKRKHDVELSEIVAESHGFIVAVHSEGLLKTFHLKYLADAR